MSKELRRLIHEHQVPRIIVTYDLWDVTGVGDRVCFLERGKPP